MDLTTTGTNQSTGYVCAGCGQYIYYAWGVHACPGKPIQFYTYTPPAVDLSEVLEELREIKAAIKSLYYNTSGDPRGL